MKKNNWLQRNKYKLVYGVILVAVGGGIFYIARTDGPVRPLSETQQKSLISVETKAVENNQKPSDVVPSISKRLDKLKNNYKYQGVELMYTSVQNAALYYNNGSYMMSGEIDYSRTSKDPLSGTKHNLWLQGFVKELTRQNLVAQGVNSNTIVAMPDFKSFSTYQKSASPELKQLLLAGEEAQKENVVVDGQVNHEKAAIAYDKVYVRYQNIKSINAKSKYLQDVNSLLRYYHDLAFGYIMSNNEKQSGSNIVYNDTAMKQLKKIKSGDHVLSDEMNTYLKKFTDNKVKSSVYNTNMSQSITTYGSSVYWQSSSDISSLATGSNSTSSSSNSSSSSSSTK